MGGRKNDESEREREKGIGEEEEEEERWDRESTGTLRQ